MPAPQGRSSSVFFRALGVFAAALAFLLMLAPTAPFSKELGACESVAVRDVLAGHIVLPYFEPGSMVQVPPLSWWAAALSVRMLGWTEFAMRIPEIAAAALTCAILFAWLVEAQSLRAGLWAVVVLLLCHFFADAARQPLMDAMLAMFVTAAAVTLERAQSAHSSRRAVLLGTSALMMALGSMTKGPLGILLPGLALGLFALGRRRLRQLFTAPIILTFAAATALVSVWYVAAYRVGGEHFLEWQVYGVLFHRFLSSEIFGHSYCKHPFYYYAPHVLTGFWPWSLYLPAMALWLWRRRSALPEPVSFALWWFFGIFGFFSASAGKCLVYILPAFPPLAALFGCLIAEVSVQHESDRPFARWFSAGTAAAAICALAIAGIAVALALLGLPATIPIRLHRSDLGFLRLFVSIARGWSSGFVAWLFISTAGAVLALIGAARGKFTIQASGVAALCAAGAIFWFAQLSPARVRQETLKRFAADLDRIVPVEGVVRELGFPDCDLAFYFPRQLGSLRELDCAAYSGSANYTIVSEEQFRALSDRQRACLKPIAASSTSDSHGRRLLMLNFSANSPATAPSASPP